MRLLDLMDPEETVGNLWHDMARGIGADVSYPDAAIAFGAVRPSLAVLFRALGGAPGVELGEAPATLMRHRRPFRRNLAAERDREWIASFDGERLALPPFIAAFSEPDLNRAAFFWLTALAATAERTEFGFQSDSLAFDCAQIQQNSAATTAAYSACPGLRDAYQRMAKLCVQSRPKVMRPEQEQVLEAA